jgi:hypothetical protein
LKDEVIISATVLAANLLSWALGVCVDALAEKNRSLVGSCCR